MTRQWWQKQSQLYTSFNIFVLSHYPTIDFFKRHQALALQPLTRSIVNLILSAEVTRQKWTLYGKGHKSNLKTDAKYLVEWCVFVDRHKVNKLVFAFSNHVPNNIRTLQSQQSSSWSQRHAQHVAMSKPSYGRRYKFKYFFKQIWNCNPYVRSNASRECHFYRVSEHGNHIGQKPRIRRAQFTTANVLGGTLHKRYPVHAAIRSQWDERIQSDALVKSVTGRSLIFFVQNFKISVVKKQE